MLTAAASSQPTVTVTLTGPASRRRCERYPALLFQLRPGAPDGGGCSSKLPVRCP